MCKYYIIYILNLVLNQVSLRYQKLTQYNIKFEKVLTSVFDFHLSNQPPPELDPKYQSIIYEAI